MLQWWKAFKGETDCCASPASRFAVYQYHVPLKIPGHDLPFIWRRFSARLKVASEPANPPPLLDGKRNIRITGRYSLHFN